MAVSIGAVGTEQIAVGSPADLAGTVITTVAGDTALLVALYDSTSSGIYSCTWDQGTSNQVMTSIGSIAVSGGATVYFFGLVNPAIGAKTLRVTGTVATTLVNGLSFQSTKTTSVAACFTNAATNTGNSGTASVVVTSASGNMVAAIHASPAGTVSSVNQTSWFIGLAGAWGGNYANGAASVSLTGTLSSADEWASLGINIAQPDGPFSPDDWPVPRRRRSLLQDYQQSSAIELFTFVGNQPRSPVLWRRKPRVDASAAQTTLLGTPQPLFPVETPAPFNETDWPNPRGPRRGVQDWSDSFKLPLQEVLPPNQEDWPVPKGSCRGVQDWIGQTPNTLTVLPDTPPIAQYDWPVPKRAARNPQDWSDSFKLPLQEVLPPNQTDWPNPPRGPHRNPQDWIFMLVNPPLPPEPSLVTPMMGQIWMG